MSRQYGTVYCREVGGEPIASAVYNLPTVTALGAGSVYVYSFEYVNDSDRSYTLTFSSGFSASVSGTLGTVVSSLPTTDVILAPNDTYAFTLTVTTADNLVNSVSEGSFGTVSLEFGAKLAYFVFNVGALNADDQLSTIYVDPAVVGPVSLTSGSTYTGSVTLHNTSESSRNISFFSTSSISHTSTFTLSGSPLVNPVTVSAGTSVTIDYEINVTQTVPVGGIFIRATWTSGLFGSVTNNIYQGILVQNSLTITNVGGFCYQNVTSIRGGTAATATTNITDIGSSIPWSYRDNMIWSGTVTLPSQISILEFDYIDEIISDSSTYLNSSPMNRKYYDLAIRNSTTGTWTYFTFASSFGGGLENISVARSVWNSSAFSGSDTVVYQFVPRLPGVSWSTSNLNYYHLPSPIFDNPAKSDHTRSSFVSVRPRAGAGFGYVDPSPTARDSTTIRGGQLLMVDDSFSINAKGVNRAYTSDPYIIQNIGDADIELLRNAGRNMSSPSNSFNDEPIDILISAGETKSLTKTIEGENFQFFVDYGYEEYSVYDPIAALAQLVDEPSVQYSSSVRGLNFNNYLRYTIYYSFSWTGKIVGWKVGAI